MTRYVEAFSWTGTIQEFLDVEVTERPLLNVCAGRTRWGDVTMDRYEPSSVLGDWTMLPFKADSFGAVFADPPWDAAYKKPVADFVREALRVAPVAYLMAPWIYGAAWCQLTNVWVRQMPGVNTAILLTRYESRRTPLDLSPTQPCPACGRRMVDDGEHWFCAYNHRAIYLADAKAALSPTPTEPQK